MVHGDLKGVRLSAPVASFSSCQPNSRSQPNILINDHGRACLADFGLAIIIRGFTSSGFDKDKSKGTPVWMSPEVCWPDRFGLGTDARPRKESDVYALGTVIYEVCVLHILVATPEIKGNRLFADTDLSLS